jgi:hypothetical protein
MKTSVSKRASRLGASLSLGLVLLSAMASSVSAQTVTTTPVGAVTNTISVGLNNLGVSVLNANLLTSACSSNTASTVTLSGSSNVGALLTTGQPYYLEVTAGDASIVGDRFDVDTTATIASANGVVTLNTASVNNTSALTTNVASGATFALRKHITLAQLQGFFSTALVGSNTAANADQVWFYNAATDSFSVYYLRADLVNWRLSGSATNVSNTVIAPGVGVLFRKVTSGATLVAVGGVRTNNFALPLTPGLKFVASGYPVDASPSAVGGTVALGWTGNNVAGNADQLQVYNPTTDAFVSYYLRADGTTWRQVGTTTAVTTSSILGFNSAYMIKRNAADASYAVISPVAP